jgi:hypothetical protein
MQHLCEEDPKLTLVLVYEAAKYLFSHPFNRIAWSLEPPQSVAEYASTRMQIIGDFYSSFIRLYRTNPPSDDHFQESDEWEKQWGLVKTYLPLLGSAWASKNQARIDTANGLYKSFLAEMDWMEIFELLSHVEENYATLLARHSQTPIGEPEREQKRWKNKDLSFPATFGDASPKVPRRRHKDPVTPKKRKRSGKGSAPASSKRARRSKENPASSGEEEQSDSSAPSEDNSMPDESPSASRHADVETEATDNLAITDTDMTEVIAEAEGAVERQDEPMPDAAEEEDPAEPAEPLPDTAENEESADADKSMPDAAEEGDPADPADPAEPLPDTAENEESADADKSMPDAAEEGDGADPAEPVPDTAENEESADDADQVPPSQSEANAAKPKIKIVLAGRTKKTSPVRSEEDEEDEPPRRSARLRRGRKTK